MSAISTFYHRRASNTSSKPTIPAVIPYRNAAGQLKYTSVASSNGHATSQSSPRSSSQGYDYLSDSDGVPLLASRSQHQELTDDEKARFTATGGPMRAQAFNPLHNMAGDMFTAPRYLPKQYTDESIIPVIVVNVVPSQKKLEMSGKKKRSMSITSMFKGDKPEKDPSKKITRIVFMPRGEYLKRFAKDDNGTYIGTMPQKEWSEDDLDEKYGIFRPIPRKQKGSADAWNSIANTHTGRL